MTDASCPYVIVIFFALAEGYVVANDSDNKRCYLMVHQVRRLVSSNFIVMNMDASSLPQFKLQVRFSCYCKHVLSVGDEMNV